MASVGYGQRLAGREVRADKILDAGQVSNNGNLLWYDRHLCTVLKISSNGPTISYGEFDLAQGSIRTG